MASVAPAQVASDIFGPASRRASAYASTATAASASTRTTRQVRSEGPSALQRLPSRYGWPGG